MAPKRKAPASVGYSDSKGEEANKRSATAAAKKSNASASPEKASSSAHAKDSNVFDHSRPEERYGIVQRDFYPREMSNERCAMYNDNEIPRPIEVLHTTMAETQQACDDMDVGDSVIHWFKRDLRLFDNRGLRMASEKAKTKGVPLICMFIVSPQDYQAHFTSPARVDFELRTLKIMKDDLAKLDIPLHIETIEKRKDIPHHLMSLFSNWGAKHVYCNIEYEVDELRREEKMIRKCLDMGIAFNPVHDDVVVAPGELSTGAGKQYAVYSPWFRSWIAHVHANPNLLEASEGPEQNPSDIRKRFKDIFDMKIPEAPSNKSLTSEEKKRFEHLWPAGEHEAMDRLNKFLKQKIGKYKDARNLPGSNATATVSVHHSAGTLAARTSVRAARDADSTKKLDGGNSGIASWISEVAWRDFYKHVLAHWPYVCMFKPFKYEYTNIKWEYNDSHFEAWCAGQTGFPIVDAAMRQLNHTGYMHNRCRMIVASFLAKDLLLDWRMGEKYFMEHLIDGDFASNNGGWGFSASTGVDPQPYFRIFNPLLQSEKFDSDGEYIRKWVPELKSVEGKAIHDPYSRGAAKIAEKNGYPKPIVEHKGCRERALARYKQGIGRETA
ncbi:deoxyribodipyrimidine photo-lyase [Aulographum hederae CBS 113979]|uniref:Deoxyribodipyrimidine photo-lyase n=1 Tax=Aulographum hederae CBS 113979 TaxID=1176131 RepID=A0A6G1HBW2_9PEZI|nr:deoxyribodipyrimidine photo-lyase [Aulographum hederae CBS 113979]